MGCGVVDEAAPPLTRGKGLFGLLDGSARPPTDAKELDIWKLNNVKIRGSLLNKEVPLALDVVLAAVLHEETRLGTQDAMESTPLPSIGLLAGKSAIVSSTQNTKRSVQCYECQDFGHITTHCPKKKNIYAYCKITGYHISDCRRRPNHSRTAHQAYQTNVTTSSGSSNSINSTWHLDSGASNHMTGDLSQFSSFSSGVSKHVIHIENGHTLPASGIGSVGNLSNVLYVPNLKANLVSVG
ncbi:hypothetical protein BC332_13960 [Capsicum chinense]|nr:hypothetical protein BC332_13960 [Capsicum chinense]